MGSEVRVSDLGLWFRLPGPGRQGYHSSKCSMIAMLADVLVLGLKIGLAFEFRDLGAKIPSRNAGAEEPRLYNRLSQEAIPTIPHPKPKDLALRRYRRTSPEPEHCEAL